VPKWKDSSISFKNVYISRRPPSSPSNVVSTRKSGHMAAVGYDVSNHPAYHEVDDEVDDVLDSYDSTFNNNWSMFDLNVDSIDVTLSLRRWLDGKGLVKDAFVKGVRGVLGE
jgi:distribution and morphology protein 31